MSKSNFVIWDKTKNEQDWIYNLARYAFLNTSMNEEQSFLWACRAFEIRDGLFRIAKRGSFNDEKLCDYCENKKICNVSEKMKVLVVDGFGNKPQLRVSTEFMSKNLGIALRIKFCPYCGRKLERENDD